MLIRTLALTGFLAFALPIAAQAENAGPHKIIAAKVTVNGNYAAGKNKKLDKIVAVASVPLSQVGKGKNRKKGDVRLTIIEAKNGKRKVSCKNLDKSSELYTKLRQTLEDSILYYKQNHLDQVQPGSGKRESSSHRSSGRHRSSHRSGHRH